MVIIIFVQNLMAYVYNLSIYRLFIYTLTWLPYLTELVLPHKIKSQEQNSIKSYSQMKRTSGQCRLRRWFRTIGPAVCQNPHSCALSSAPLYTRIQYILNYAGRGHHTHTIYNSLRDDIYLPLLSPSFNSLSRLTCLRFKLTHRYTHARAVFTFREPLHLFTRFLRESILFNSRYAKRDLFSWNIQIFYSYLIYVNLLATTYTTRMHLEFTHEINMQFTLRFMINKKT